MRRIAIINQKGGVGKTTTSVNLGAALAEQGRRVVVADLDPQANLSLHLGIEPETEQPSAYTVLHGATTFAQALRATSDPNLRVLPSNIDLSGAELELASAIGRDNLLSDAIEAWEAEQEGSPADYLIFDCPPSLGLLSINALAAAHEVIITVQTEFLALMGMSKLVEVVALIRRRLNPRLEITGIAPCLYDSRLRLAREVLGEIRKYFPGQVFRQNIRSNVKLAEAPSFGLSIIEYAPDSNGALDYRRLALEVIEQEVKFPALAGLPAPRPIEDLPTLRAEDPAAEIPARPAALPIPGAVSAAPRGVDLAPAPKGSAPKGPAPIPKVVLKPAPPPSAASTSQVAHPPQSEPRAPSPTPTARPAGKALDSVIARRAALKQRDAVEEELRIMRRQNLPPLPPGTLEIER